jgi:hypothetical protein
MEINGDFLVYDSLLFRLLALSTHFRQGLAITGGFCFLAINGDVWPLPVGFVAFWRLCGVFWHWVIVSGKFLVGL